MLKQLHLFARDEAIGDYLANRITVNFQRFDRLAVALAGLDVVNQKRFAQIMGGANVRPLPMFDNAARQCLFGEAGRRPAKSSNEKERGRDHDDEVDQLRGGQERELSERRLAGETVKDDE